MVYCFSEIIKCTLALFVCCCVFSVTLVQLCSGSWQSNDWFVVLLLRQQLTILKVFTNWIWKYRTFRKRPYSFLAIKIDFSKQMHPPNRDYSSSPSPTTTTTCPPQTNCEALLRVHSLLVLAALSSHMKLRHLCLELSHRHPEIWKRPQYSFSSSMRSWNSPSASLLCRWWGTQYFTGGRVSFSPPRSANVNLMARVCSSCSRREDCEGR